MSSKTHHVYFNVLFSFKTTLLLCLFLLMLKPVLLPNPNTKSSCIIAYSPTKQVIYLHVLPFLRYTHRYKSSLLVSEFKQKKLKIKERACRENILVTCPKLTSLKNNLNFIIMFYHVFLLLFIRFQICE